MTEEISQPAAAPAQPELKQVLGALLFAARKPMTVEELLAVLAQVSQNGAAAAASFGKIQKNDIRAALDQLNNEFIEHKLGLMLVEVAGGFRFQTDPTGGPWVRHLLNLDKPARLSKPALETLAIIAYRQPATRTEIEALRGVNVDAMMRHLLELQLIRIVGRSELPGRPLMYGTTQLFLEHFGLSSVKNLPGVEQLSRRDAERVKREGAGNAQQTLAAGTEKTEDAPQPPEDGLPAVAPSEGNGAKAGQQTTDASPETTAEANAQPPVEEQAEDDSAEETDAGKEADGDKAADAAEPEEPEDDEDEDEEDEQDEDDDEDDDDDDEDEEDDDEARK